MSDPAELNAWHDQVDRYVTELSSIVDRIHDNLDSLRLTTVDAGPSKIQPSLEQLAGRLESLQQMVVRRDTLLRDAAAPPGGFTLTEKLLSTHRVDDARLARRCRLVADDVTDVHTRATSLFICHYHLHDFTAQLVRTVTGDRRSETYGGNPATASPPRGGIFDDAA